MLLASNATKPAREQLTLIRLFEDLRGRGYYGGYDAVRRYAKRRAKERGQATASAFGSLNFAPGEAFQFDWNHEVLGGVTVIVKVADVRLCHSRMLFVRAYPRLYRGLHVVVDAASASALEQSERAVMRVEHQLLRLARDLSQRSTSYQPDGNCRSRDRHRLKPVLVGAEHRKNWEKRWKLKMKSRRRFARRLIQG